MEEIFIILTIALFVAMFYLFQELQKSQNDLKNTKADYEKKIGEIKIKHKSDIKKARRQSVETSRNVIKGQIAEQFAPLLSGFPYIPSDSHFLGSPIDYVIFNGYTNYKDGKALNDSLEIVLVDIKYNTASLRMRQKQIAKAVEAGRVRFETIRILPNGKVNVERWKDATKKTVAEKQVKEKEEQDIEKTESQKNMDRFLRKFPKAYAPWDEKDDCLLEETFEEGMSVREISLLLKRNPGKIQARLEEKGLFPKG